jgi:hypothetical protein
MGWLFGRKKEEFIDLTERYKKQQSKLIQEKSVTQKTESSEPMGFGIFGMASSTTTASSSDIDNSGPDDKRKKLARRIMDMTDKLEELSNQIYHLQQRLEVLEKRERHGY